jgi:hypothetical protein
MLIATITAIATIATTQGTTCAAIDNRSNTAAWVTPSGQVRTSTYRDMDRIMYADAPGPRANAAWRALHAAERRLRVNADGSPSTPGPKVRIACRR